MAKDRTFLHVDMDAFFAAIEQLDNPALRGKPVIVGAPKDARGVVSTCSYEARVFGVHSGMPSRTAHKLCPLGLFVPVRGERYREVSQQIREVFANFSPYVEPISVDEAFIDITGSMHLFGGDVGTAQQLKERIRAETGLTASVGVAPNKFLAKLGSDLEKPDGLTVVPRQAEAIRAFLAPLPMSRVWGLGGKSVERLQRLGLNTIGDLQEIDEARLEKVIGTKAAAAVKRLAFGLDDREIVLDTEDKSISHEHTFGEDCDDWQAVERTLLKLAEKVGQRLRRSGRAARTAHLKLRWEDFQTITRQTPLQPPCDTDHSLFEAAALLLGRARQPRPVRLVGFGVSALTEPDAAPALYQPGLFDAPDDKRQARDQELDRAVDEIRGRFGRNSVQRAEW